MVWGQSAGLLATREPHHACGHCCLLCHVGPLPFLQTTSGARLAPIMLLERLAPNPDFEASHDVLPSANSSRAPPA
jgi:hypothetical protein